MPTFKSFEEIEVWQRARKLSKRIYELSTTGTFARDFALRNQINDATGSIMHNIAEGFERGGNREFIQALAIAKGSAGEVQSQLYCAVDRKHISQQEFDELRKEAIRIGKMIGSLIQYLASSEIKGPKFKRGKSKESQTQDTKPDDANQPEPQDHEPRTDQNPSQPETRNPKPET